MGTERRSHTSFLALHPWRMLCKVLSCINADKILPENMVISDPISFNSFIFDVYKKLNGRMRCLWPVSVTKSKQVYCKCNGYQTFSLQRLWKSLLDLRRNKNLKAHVVIKVLFIDEITKRNIHHWCDVWACLFVQTSSNLGRICETTTPVSHSRYVRMFVVDIWLWSRPWQKILIRINTTQWQG